MGDNARGFGNRFRNARAERRPGPVARLAKEREENFNMAFDLLTGAGAIYALWWAGTVVCQALPAMRGGTYTRSTPSAEICNTTTNKTDIIKMAIINNQKIQDFIDKNPDLGTHTNYLVSELKDVQRDTQRLIIGV